MDPSGPTDFCDLHAWTEFIWPGLPVGSGSTRQRSAPAGERAHSTPCTPSFSPAPITGGHETCEVHVRH